MFGTRIDLLSFSFSKYLVILFLPGVLPLEHLGERQAGKQVAVVVYEVGSQPVLGQDTEAGNHSSRGGMLRGPDTAGLGDGEGLVTSCPAEAFGDSRPALAGLSTPGSQWKCNPPGHMREQPTRA